MKPLLAVALCIVAAAACAMGGKSAPRMATPAPAETTAAGAPSERPAEMPGDPRSEIQQLFDKIETERTELGLAEPQAASLPPGPAQPMASTPLSTDASCKPAKTDRCTNACRFSDSICDNAKRICDLAQQLTADGGWAADKCARAKKTCETAHDNCCGCQ